MSGQFRNFAMFVLPIVRYASLSKLSVAFAHWSDLRSIFFLFLFIFF